jgi:hypothetical protein
MGASVVSIASIVTTESLACEFTAVPFAAVSRPPVPLAARQPAPQTAR